MPSLKMLGKLKEYWGKKNSYHVYEMDCFTIFIPSVVLLTSSFTFQHERNKLFFLYYFILKSKLGKSKLNMQKWTELQLKQQKRKKKRIDKK